tara:strand:+ start:513 stop:1010 length:498 start_codon:yes stop_codon:yes gene_type:complete
MSLLDQIVDTYEKEKEIVDKINLMSLDEMIKFISDKKDLTISGWDDEYNSVRVGLDWDMNTGDLFFLIERNSVKLAVRDAMEVLVLGYDRWKVWDNKRKRDFFSDVKTYLHIIDNDLSEHESLLPILKDFIAERSYIPENETEMIERMRKYFANTSGYREAPLLI